MTGNNSGQRFWTDEVLNAFVDLDAQWPLIPILKLSDLRLPNRGGRWT